LALELVVPPVQSEDPQNSNENVDFSSWLVDREISPLDFNKWIHDRQSFLSI
jgi:hypothetical protein